MEDINEFLTTEVDRKINEGKHSGLQFNGVSVDLPAGRFRTRRDLPETEISEYHSPDREPDLLRVGRAAVYLPSAVFDRDELRVRAAHRRGRAASCFRERGRWQHR